MMRLKLLSNNVKVHTSQILEQGNGSLSCSLVVGAAFKIY